MDARIQKLLELQDHDTLKLQNEQQLNFLPKEIETLRGKITAEENRMVESKSNMKKMEVQRNDWRNERKGLEAQILKYKNQQRKSGGAGLGTQGQ